MKKTTDALKRRLVELTRDLILLPTSVSSPKNIERGFELIKNHLEETETVDIQVYDVNNALSMVAGHPNNTKPDLYLCGHLDVISHPEDVKYSSSVKDGKIHGPGAADMKGTLAILLEIFRNFHLHHPEVSLGIIITSDEERGGKFGVKHLFETVGLRCNAAIVPDSGTLNKIIIEEKGLLHMILRNHGSAGHACRPWLVENTLDTLIRNVQQIKAYFEKTFTEKDHWCPTFSVTNIQTENTVVNRIPSMAEALCDVRFPSPYTVDQILQAIQKNIEKEMEIDVLVSAETAHFSPDQRFIRITEEVTGKPVMASRPEVGNIHSESEWIDIDSMVSLYTIYERYLNERFGLY